MQRARIVSDQAVVELLVDADFSLGSERGNLLFSTSSASPVSLWLIASITLVREAHHS